MVGIVALTAAYVLSQFYRSFLAVLTPILSQELGATNAELSAASGTWFIVFALMQFAVGIWLDKFGPRRTASFLFGGFATAGALLLALATAPWAVIVSMGLIGIGCAPVLMSSVFIFAKSYSPARLAVLTSWFIGIGMMGSIIGTAPLAAAADMFGWRTVMVGFAAITVLIALAILTCVKEPEPEARKAGDSVLGGYRELLRTRALWFIIPMAMVATVPSQAIRGLWAGPYLSDVYHADALLIGQVTFFMALALAIGSFFYGPLDTIFGTRKWINFWGALMTIAVLLWLAMVPSAPIFHMTAALVVIGFCGGTYGVVLAHGKSFMPAHLTGRGVTLLNFFSIGSVGLTQFVTGGIFSAAATPADPAWGYQVVFFFFALMIGAGLLVYLFSTDAKPERQELVADVAE
jgi:MFS family permease